MNDEEFWLVFNPNGPRGGTPTCRHDSERSATNEAERLARLHPGESFYVLRATHMRVCDSMQRVTLKSFEPPL